MANPIQVVQFPFSAFGHIMPHFHLAIALASSGVHVFLVGTPKNLHRLPQIPPPLAALITLVPLPLPPLHGGDSLPAGAEATMDLPLHQIPLLEQALDLLEPSFRQFLADLPAPPHWFIVDFNATWICNVSRDLNIPILFFNVMSTGFLAFMDNAFKIEVPDIGNLTSPADFDGFQSAISYRRFEASAMLNAFPMKNSTGTSVHDRVEAIQSASEAIMLRACYESDPHYLNFYSRNCGKRVVPLGLLPPEKPKKTEYAADSPWKSIFEWLDKQNPQSVVFVGFGSECRLTRDQIREIARGLELSGLPFLWSLRKQSSTAAMEDSDSESDDLPSGFRQRTAERGIVSLGWAPQMEVLAHPAIGGCLFHGGWGSAIEALQFGHCLVVLPFIIDQPLCARVLVEKGVGVEVERMEDGSFSGEAIAKALREALVSEEIRKNAKEAAAIVGDRELHHRYIQDFVEFLKNGN